MFSVEAFLAWDRATPRPDFKERVAYRNWEYDEDRLKQAMRDEWANYYDVREAQVCHWGRLLNKLAPDPGIVWLPPGSDHTSMWNRKTKIGRGRQRSEVLVTQPYGFEHNLKEMQAFADENGFCFWVSEQPAWHWQGQVCHIEWTTPDSEFASRRNMTDAHQIQRTTFTYGI